MTAPIARILLLADTHLGFDMPVSPRVRRRRRGPDFFANYHRALDRVRKGGYDIVVHGGDVFHRSRVRPEIVHRAFRSLKRIADWGVPVYVVPGNHERSRIPHALLAEHPSIFVFDRPRTFTAEIRGRTVAFAGFPFVRSIRNSFRSVLDQTGWQSRRAVAHVLCLHQCVEGATVGPHDFMFRNGEDVVRHDDVPDDFCAVLSGHIHRQQTLTEDLKGRPLETPVFYPGSTERTSFAEQYEPKGFLEICLVDDRDSLGRTGLQWRFHRLPVRPMTSREIVAPADADELRRQLRILIENAPRDAVLRLRVSGRLSDRTAQVLGAASLRSLVPDTMNIEVRTDHDRPTRRARSTGRRIRHGRSHTAASAQRTDPYQTVLVDI